MCRQHPQLTLDQLLENTYFDCVVLGHLVADDDTPLQLRRPTLTVCLHRRSGDVLGYHLGLEPPGCQSVSQCIRHVILPKNNLRERYLSVVHPWDCNGHLESLAVDNKSLEFPSHSIEAMARTFVSRGILNSPRSRHPLGKSIADRLIGTLRRAIVNGQPGTIICNIQRKDTYDAAKHTAIKLSTLREIIHTWIADIYHPEIRRMHERKLSSVWAEQTAPVRIPLMVHETDLDSAPGMASKRMLNHKEHSLIDRRRLPDDTEALAQKVIRRFYNARPVMTKRQAYEIYCVTCKADNVEPMSYRTFCMRACKCRSFKEMYSRYVKVPAWKMTRRAVTRKGIQLHGLRYNNDELAFLYKHFGFFRTKIRFNPANLSHIYVLHPQTDEAMLRVPALNQPYTTHLSLREHKDWMRQG